MRLRPRMPPRCKHSWSPTLSGKRAHDAGDLGQQLVGKKAQWANSPGEPIACCCVQVHTPTRGYECRRATSEQPGDDTSKDIPRSRGCQPYISFLAYGHFPPRRRDKRERAFQRHDRIQFGRGLTCGTGRFGLDVVSLQAHKAGHLTRVRCDDDASLMTLEK